MSIEENKNAINDPVLNSHVNAFKVQIGEMMLKRHRIYIDTKYWIYLRDAVTSGEQSIRLEIYRTLRRLVESKVAICPLSPHVFEELMKQPFERRLATTRIMDELSEQICFIFPLQIFGQELINLVRHTRDPVKYIWTKVAFVTGESFPTLPGLPEDQQRAMQIGFFDHISTFSLEKMLQTIGDKSLPKRKEDIIERLNVGKDNNQDWKTFPEVFMQEVTGALDVLKKDIEEVCLYLRTNGNANLQETELRKLIYQLFHENKIGKYLPSVRVHSGLHAYFRFNKDQRFKKNDLPDFSHAAWALPYCHTFLTERRLAGWICNGLLKLDQVYGTKVLYEEDDALEHLRYIEKQAVK